MINKPIPPNNVLDPKYNGWLIKHHTYTFASQTNEITIHDITFDSPSKVISLSNQEIKELSDAFDLKEIEYHRDEILKLEKRLGIDRTWG